MRTFADFYSALTEEETPVVDRLRQIAVDCAPHFREKISYGVPYYFLNTRVCFIWPACVKPGPKSGVVFGFCNGNLLSDPFGVLERENRKQVYWITYHSETDIDEEILREMIHEAIFIDEQFFGKKKKT